MIQPLALVFYERLLPGTQLVNRLQDLQYRVQTVAMVDELATAARQHLPMLVLVDLQPVQGDVFAAVAQLKADPDTAHLPVVGFVVTETPNLTDQARKSGVKLIVQDQALLSHLPQFLEQALQLD